MAKSDPRHEQVLEWVERVAMFCTAEYGVPPIAGRVLGWLMICEPAEQSADEIGAAIGASRASLATNMRVLVDGGFVRRRTKPGERTHYFRMVDDAWETVVRRRVTSLTAFRDVAAEGMSLAGADSPRANRLRAAHDVYDWMAKRLSEDRR
ncbi:transcriptional regulator [Amycolatopsis sp. SID8362]|uniref:GbsR/MarR family transcriptional regulator n=1 Tax=Amycolatopsis sp. SID8362 TaxID=2690346 RepID=UPI00136EA2A4|nr:transcriptional regulator [Amycolatopsis sp. SID8362]NBH03351.1 transcriptional regulator [Amycolatopsis sp. SID8362]NED40052.1 transcriptional regulator [Amycolatopsis sp. SID8362]